MPDSNTQQEVPTLVRYRTLTDRLDAIDTKIVAATFDIDTLAAAGALDGVDLVAVSQSGTEKKATLAQVWRQDAQAGGAFVQTGAGSSAGGYAKDVGSTITASGHGSFAGGFATGGGSITTVGHLAFGRAASSGDIYSDGGFAFGVSTGSGGSLSAVGSGSFAVGSASNAGITAYGVGAFAGGSAQSGDGTGYVEAVGTASFAFGAAGMSYDVRASGIGSFAFGYPGPTQDIVASSANSVQFGPGTNAIADSLRVGTGIRLHGIGGATPGVLANGDIWLDGDGHVKIRSNGATVSI